MTQLFLKALLILSQAQLFFIGIRGFATLPRVRRSRPSATRATKLTEAGKEVTNERVPWDFGRFLKQSSKFVTLPRIFPRTTNKVVVRPGDVIWSAGDTKQNFFTFSPLDDVVMGGASESTFDKETGTWKGTVTSANNGGFVGIRSTLLDQPLDMSKCTGLQIKIRGGEGRRFKATVRDSTEFNGIAWTSSFDTVSLPTLSFSAFSRPSQLNGGGVTTVKIPFKKLVPTLFARTVADKVFNSDSIQAIQFIYSKFEYNEGLNPNFKPGDFSVQVIEIQGY
mmetsp:Transcript_22134/g.31704  ORF Transcript_22134/g.31704 Transcript_22134/m.31704 type:complete len:280 (-) Transcript_22134:127-966(-)